MKCELLELYWKNKTIRLLSPKYSDILNSLLKKEDIESLISSRNEARRNKDYEESDKIRNFLKNKGVVLYDTKDKTTWDTEPWLDNERLYKLEFKVPDYKGDPNYWHFFPSFSIEINSRYPNNFWWMEGYCNDFDSMFNNFHLAKDFVFFTKNEKLELENDWNEETKTMLIGGKYNNGELGRKDS